MKYIWKNRKAGLSQDTKSYLGVIVNVKAEEESQVDESNRENDQTGYDSLKRKKTMRRTTSSISYRIDFCFTRFPIFDVKLECLQHFLNKCTHNFGKWSSLIAKTEMYSFKNLVKMGAEPDLF